jgi:hypothetical protein
MDPDDEDVLAPDAVEPLPGTPLAVIEQEPGVFTVGEYTYTTLEDIAWAIAKQLPNGQAIIAYRVDFDSVRATVTVVTMNPDGTHHEDESHLLESADADRVMFALAG